MSNQRIVQSKPDGTIVVTTPNLPIEEAIRINVRRIVKADIIFQDESVILAGTVLKINSFYHMAIVEQKLSPEEVGIIENNQLELLPFRIITTAELPQDRIFRGAWDDSNSEDFIGLNLVKAQAIAHEMRRADRETKMIPLDKEDGFASTSQSRKDAILIEKQVILDANAVMQIDIDLASNESMLRTALINAGIFQ